LKAIATRILGSEVDADDVLQDARSADGHRSRVRRAAAVADRLNGAKGAAPVLIDGELGAAWIAGNEVKVAFIFHVEQGLVREVELIADPEVLATMEVTRVLRSTKGTEL
jgi:hypothetical protein